MLKKKNPLWVFFMVGDTRLYRIIALHSAVVHYILLSQNFHSLCSVLLRRFATLQPTQNPLELWQGFCLATSSYCLITLITIKTVTTGYCFYSGGRYKARTCDPLNVVQVRYQLRQSPNLIIFSRQSANLHIKLKSEKFRFPQVSAVRVHHSSEIIPLCIFFRYIRF